MKEEKNKHFEFDRGAYLRRIDFAGDTSPTVENLKALHHAHFHGIPFENFDILLGRGIDLAPGAMFDKLVRNRRGGYCFELNGLFLMALKAFGFDARALLARTHVTGLPTGRGHQISLVTIGGSRWIVDVGFGGDTPRGPVPLQSDKVTTHEGQKIRLKETERFGTMLQTVKNGDWADLYSFDLEYVCQADIDYGNHFNAKER